MVVPNKRAGVRKRLAWQKCYSVFIIITRRNSADFLSSGTHAVASEDTRIFFAASLLSQVTAPLALLAHVTNNCPAALAAWELQWKSSVPALSVPRAMSGCFEAVDLASVQQADDTLGKVGNLQTLGKI